MVQFRKLTALLLGLSLLLSLSSCGQKEESYRSVPSSYWENGLNVTCTPFDKTAVLTDVNVTLSGLKDADIQNTVAQSINQEILTFENAAPQAIWGSTADLAVEDAKITLTLSVVSNFSNRLSLELKKKYTYPDDSVRYESKGLNYDLETGKALSLSDLFDLGNDIYPLLSRLLLARISAYTQAAPFEGIDRDTSFSYDAEGITLYYSSGLSYLYCTPGSDEAIEISYTGALFEHLTIFDREPSLALYESLPNTRHLIAYPSEVSENIREVINGMQVEFLSVTPTFYSSQTVKERVEHLTPLLEDLTAQSTGTEGEKASCYYYAGRVGKFMVVRLLQEEASGMNSFSSDRVYVFDAVTGENMPVSSLFIHGFDYTRVIASLLYPDADQTALNQEINALSQAQIIPRENGFLIRYTAAALSQSALYPGSDPTVSYADLGYENLLIYE